MAQLCIDENGCSNGNTKNAKNSMWETFNENMNEMVAMGKITQVSGLLSSYEIFSVYSDIFGVSINYVHFMTISK